MHNTNFGVCATHNSHSPFLYLQWQGQAYHRSALAEENGSKYLPSEG